MCEDLNAVGGTKIQLFNTAHWERSNTKMLYFDLDTVIVGNIDWLWQGDSNKFWAPRDFKYFDA